jgi:hypothetical protein
MISTIFVSSFLATGDVSFTVATVTVLAAAALVMGLSMFGLLREASKRMSPGMPGVGLPLRVPVMQGEEWEESPTKEEGEE